METNTDKLNSKCEIFSSNENRNINFVIIKNITENETINLNDYLDIFKSDTSVNSDLVNKNINIIIIENIQCFGNIEPKVTINDKQIKSSEIVSQDNNLNIDFIVVKNIINNTK